MYDLWCRLVFAGGWRVAAARSVGRGGEPADDAAVCAAVARVPAPLAARLRDVPRPRGRRRGRARRIRHPGPHQEPAQGTLGLICVHVLQSAMKLGSGEPCAADRCLLAVARCRCFLEPIRSRLKPRWLAHRGVAVVRSMRGPTRACSRYICPQ